MLGNIIAHTERPHLIRTTNTHRSEGTSRTIASQACRCVPNPAADTFFHTFYSSRMSCPLPCNLHEGSHITHQQSLDYRTELLQVSRT
jgi:hypothetical protein